MRQGMLYRATAFFQDVKGAFDAFADTIEQAVELRRILNALVLAFGRPDMNPMPCPVSLPLFAEEAFVRPSVTVWRKRIQDFVSGIPLIGIGGHQFKRIRRAVERGQHDPLVAKGFQTAGRPTAVLGR